MKTLGWAEMASDDDGVESTWLYGNDDITDYGETDTDTGETKETCCVQYFAECYGGESLSFGALRHWKFGAINVIEDPSTYMRGKYKKYRPFLYWNDFAVYPEERVFPSFDTLEEAKAYVEREYMKALFEGEL